MTPASSSTLARLSAASLPVWLVDDEADVRDSLSQWLEVSGLEVRTFSRAGKALNALQNGQPCGVVVSDIKMPEMDGLALFAAVQALDTPPPVILITGHGDVPMAVAAIQQGAWDFVQKPFDPERLEECVRRALEHRALALENLQLQQALRHNYLSTRLLGDSALMQVLRRQVENLAASRANVVINGETGSGKEVVARALHDFGSGSQGAFVALNCGAMNSELIESELFGHEKGAFTGAGERRIGLLETASHGTLFLDEIESLPLSAQVKLLRALQEGEITRLGSNQVIHLHLRVVAASKENLLQMVSQGDFREDLYYRLAIAELAIPPLRERREDIPLLFRHFCHQAAEVHERPLREPTTELLTALGNHRWPGNLRELRNIATRFILGLDLPWQRSSMPSHQASALSVRMEVFEATVLKEALQRHHGNIQAVLDELDLPRRTLNQKMQRHQLRREDFLAT
ncbi:sigma-54-dependent transcriptional regulator [Vreelandella venusta]|uniref:sigma-54-dependent transcriptional regulator n=1 Tax=Vreelandella venusta TaxID=44935 RepID=UPI0022857800|nr:sigma-54 dependent transcriptional regulator [Halomonas venusta]WAM51862.1 sigma-54 dependent transcriptional regulator [Halomonas venusta]